VNRKSFVVRALLVSVFVLFASGARGYAQQAAVDQVKGAIEAYHAALESLDGAKMAPLWLHDQSVTLLNPRDKSIAVGWDAVRKDWETTLAPEAELKLTQAAGPYIRVSGNVAWSVGIVDSAIKLKSGQAISAPTIQTDVFEKQAGKWLLVSHTASRVPQ
jgi:ketosteroid isomerase-like protein